MLRTIALLILATTFIACSQTLMANSQQSTAGVKPTMSSTSGISVKNLSLRAREEKNPPPGALPPANRDIGFAAVFLRLENHQQENIKVTIQKIEVRNLADGKVQLATTTPQEFVLKPLEISDQSFHLKNKIGFPKQGKVKAVITYKIGNRTQVIESAAVDVDRL
jgi:hypothetical protein